MPSRDIRPPSRSRLSLFFASPGLPTTIDESNEPPVSSRTRSHAQAMTLLGPSGGPNPSSTEHSEKSRRMSLPKTRKLSRVFADFSLLDPFTSRKSVDDLRASRSKPKSTLVRPATSHGHTHKASLGESSIHSFDTKSSRPTSPTSPLPSSVPPISAITMPISEPKLSIEKVPQSSTMLDTPSTPQIKPSIPSPPESIPLPSIRPSSSHGPASGKKRRKSLDLIHLGDGNTGRPLSTRSRSLRVTPISLSRPSTPKSATPIPDLSPDTRDPPASPEAARQHFVEVKRARKMTQLFGQELPPELIRALDDGRNHVHPRRRNDSTASSTIDSVPSTPMHESFAGVLEGGNVTPTLPPTMPRVDFQERRRRIAKLSQFFGVNHAEIASSVVVTNPDHHHRALSFDDPQKSVPFLSEEPSEVGVKVISPRRWGLGEDMRDVEMSDAINKLRCLRAN